MPETWANIPPLAQEALARLLDETRDQEPPINRAVCTECKRASQTTEHGEYRAHCRICQDTGNVCPLCLGMRFVRADKPVGHPDFGKISRCACCEGNQCNPIRERAIIAIYMAGWGRRLLKAA